jgi:mono/diheme cytochrome c family protein
MGREAMKRTSTLLISLLILLLAAACGGNQQAATPMPTITSFPTYEYITPTSMPTRVPATQEASGVDTVALDRGRQRYEALECGTCHGANAEGGDAAALAGLTMSADEFLTFLRSGGGLGTSHQYASNRISNGMTNNLYQYLVSLGS